MITAAEFLKWIKVFHVLTGGSIDTGVVSWNGLTGVVNATADDVIVGTQHIFATNDEGFTDNLSGLPTITGIIDYALSTQTQLDNHVDDVNNPHQTTLQQAFLQDNTIQITGSNALDIIDNNNLQISKIKAEGTQSHVPFLGLTDGEDLTLDDTYSDVFFYNSESSTTNQISIPLETTPLFSGNSTFVAWRNGSQIFTIISAAGVTIDGIDNATITLAMGQFIKFVRLDINTWVTLSSAASGGVTSLNSLIGDLNITSPTSTISVNVSGNEIQLGVEGSDLACASYTIVGNNTMNNSFPAPGAYRLLLNDISTIFNKSSTNFTILSNGGSFGFTAARYDGLSTQQFLINIVLNLGNVNNTSGIDQNYTLSLGIGTVFSGAPVYTVISNNPMPFTLLQNAGSYTVFRSIDLNYQAVLTLNPGDIIYVVAQSAIGNAADNQIVMNYQSFSIVNLKQALSVGSGAGETLQDVYDNGDGSITVVDGKPFQILNDLGDEILTVDSNKNVTIINGGGNWTPTFTNLTGLTSIVLDGCTYSKQNNILSYCLQISFTATGADISFNHDLPSFITNNFTDIKQAKMTGQCLSSSTPTAADGKVLSVRAVVSDFTLLITANCAVGSGDYILNVSGLVEIQ